MFHFNIFPTSPIYSTSRLNAPCMSLDCWFDLDEFPFPLDRIITHVDVVSKDKLKKILYVF